MGKMSPKDRKSKTSKNKRRLKSSANKYLKPGAVAQLRNAKASASKSCTDLGKKRVALLDTKSSGDNVFKIENIVIDESVGMLSPERYGNSLMLEPVDMITQNNLMRTPKTPHVEAPEDSDSRLEALPMDVLVKVLCHLHHDQLRAVFHVSQRIRTAVLFARQHYFNYTTPDRSRQEMLRILTPLPNERWPFVSKVDGKSIWIRSPRTPKAPRHGPRPPSRVKDIEMEFSSDDDTSSSFIQFLQTSNWKSLASNRVLFCEDDLCHAVARNKLL